MLHGFFPFLRAPIREACPSLLGKVLGLKEIRHVLRLRVQVDGVVVMTVWVIFRANVVHLVGGSALHAARLGLLTGKSDPENVVRIGGEAGATDVLLVASGVDNNGVLWGTCTYLVFCLSNTILQTCLTYPGGWRPMVSCQRYRHPASFRESRDARDR
jgi:hypothetical protein